MDGWRYFKIEWGKIFNSCFVSLALLWWLETFITVSQSNPRKKQFLCCRKGELVGPIWKIIEDVDWSLDGFCSSCKITRFLERPGPQVQLLAEKQRAEHAVAQVEALKNEVGKPTNFTGKNQRDHEIPQVFPWKHLGWRNQTTFPYISYDFLDWTWSLGRHQGPRFLRPFTQSWSSLRHTQPRRRRRVMPASRSRKRRRFRCLWAYHPTAGCDGDMVTPKKGMPTPLPPSAKEKTVPGCCFFGGEEGAIVMKCISPNGLTGLAVGFLTIWKQGVHVSAFAALWLILMGMYTEKWNADSFHLISFDVAQLSFAISYEQVDAMMVQNLLRNRAVSSQNPAETRVWCEFLFSADKFGVLVYSCCLEREGSTVW